MGKYFFTLHECSGRITEDPVAHEVPDEQHVRQLAVDRARKIMASEVSEGRLCLSCWILVRDQRGYEIMTLHFGDAIDLIDANGGCHSIESSAPRASRA